MSTKYKFLAGALFLIVAGIVYPIALATGVGYEGGKNAYACAVGPSLSIAGPLAAMIWAMIFPNPPTA